MKNKLSDLNNHLFEELERLNDEELTGDALMEEIKRSEAITDIAGKIIENGSLVLKAVHEQNEYGRTSNDVPKMLIGVSKEKNE